MMGRNREEHITLHTSSKVRTHISRQKSVFVQLSNVLEAVFGSWICGGIHEGKGNPTKIMN